MKELNTSTFNFPAIIENNILYVDKTDYIWRLIRPGKGEYFMSRPRRFGKSLLVSTLKAIFQGRRELFQGLAIDREDYDWRRYPVLHFDFANCQIATSEELQTYLLHLLDLAAEELGLKRSEASPSIGFENLIYDAAKASETGSVVILIDEYDKPILGNVNNTEHRQEILNTLKGFYSCVKKCEGNIRFAFITGVSKFCHVSLFSDLNNLTDITMDAKYATMLGYTQEEFETNFCEQISATEKKQALGHAEFLTEIRKWYDGFRFHAGSESVYNPVSLARFFERGGEFSNYWFQTGTPTFLLELIMKSNFNYSEMVTDPVSESFFNAFEFTRLKPKVLLFQTGYLTIKKCVEEKIPYTNQTIRQYYLGFPNLEVERSFNEQLLEYCTVIQTESSQEFFSKLITAVGSGNADEFVRLLQSVFADIPYNIHVKNEHYYQTVCYVICNLLKLLVQAEVCTNNGRIDMMVAAGEWIYVIEFKLNKTADEALRQIEHREYAMKYRKCGKRLMLLGVNIDFDKGNITDWTKEEYHG